MNDTKKSFTQSNAFVFILAFLLGWCAYSLKLVSILKLLGELEFKYYPLLMLVQGISLFVSMKVITRASNQNEKLFYILSLATGFIIVFLTNTLDLNSWAIKQYGWVYSFIIFLLSTFVILTLDITTRLLVTSKISMLKNPKASAIVTFAAELGVILGATLSLAIAQFLEHLPVLLNPFFMSIPFTLSLGCLYFLTKEPIAIKANIENEQIKNALSEHSESLKVSVKKYLPYMVGLVTIVMVCKQFQGFAVFIGLKELQELSQQSITTIFSILAIVQNALILLFIMPSLFKRGDSTNWTRGFQYFFGFQAMSMFFISIFPVAAALVGTGIIRKITQRSFLNKSFNMLISSIPSDVRFGLKSVSQKYAHSISYLTLALFSYLAIYGYISFQSIWITAGLLSIIGIFVISHLLKKLNSFHLKNIKDFSSCPFNVYEAISSCYALANKDASNYHNEMSNILDQRETRSIFKKAIIHTIGEMKNASSVAYLMKSFKRFEREDIQVEILYSLNKFKHSEIDIFFQNVLKQTMEIDTRRGELKLSLCKTVSKRMPDSSINLANQMVLDNPEQARVVGNAIDVIGEIAKQKKSKGIYNYLFEFLDPKYSRRVRINAIKHIYRIPDYRAQCHKIIVELQNTDELEDKTGSVYLCGVLGITDYMPFVQMLDAATLSMHSTVLLTLLRLEQDNAELNFLNLLLNANREDSQRFIKQLHRIEDVQQRYLVYFTLLETYPDRVSDVLYMMRDSYKNFDKDRQMITEEAERLSIKISDDLLYAVH